MKILVTGATGFLGKHLLESLVVTGHEIVVLSRSPERARRSIGLPVSAYPWEPTEGLPPAEAFEGVHAVIHLAGESVAGVRWTRAKKRRILESREMGTRHLADAIRLHGKTVRCFISASAIGWYGETGDRVVTEASAPGSGFLAEVCQAWEEEAKKTNVRTVRLRIGLVLGQEGALAKLLPLFRLGLGGPVGGGNQWMSWIHVQDLVGLIGHCLETEAISGPVNGVVSQPVTNREFTRALAKTVGRPAVLPAPGFALRLGLGEMAELALKSQRVSNHTVTNYPWKYPDIYSALKEIIPTPSQRCEERFTAHQWLEQPVDEVFPFFSDPRNLEKITPPWLRFKVEGDVDANIYEGQKINYRLKIRHIPVRWQSRIEKWNPNQEFVDTQLKGPYRKWHHTHQFQPLQHGTLITDRVRYEVPGGVWGNLFLGSWIRKDIRTIFRYRRDAIENRYPPTTDR